jgi:hypothetical protein
MKDWFGRLKKGKQVIGKDDTYLHPSSSYLNEGISTGKPTLIKKREKA